MLPSSFQDIEVVLVDDEQSELDAYQFLLQSMGVKKILTIADSRKVMDELEHLRFPVVFLDLNMPYISGQEILSSIKKIYPQIPVVITTANSEIETAVKCLKLGAHDYLVKPINLSTFGSALRTACEINSLRNEVLSLKGFSFAKGSPRADCFKQILTQSPAMESVFQYIDAISASREPVLILGETGVGKELIAKAVHESSQCEGEFVPIDVSGLDDTLFSDTLFGHERGAFSGAESFRLGLVEKARKGTLFLDEIGDLHQGSQVKLLRLLQEGVYYPLGADRGKLCEARIVAATNVPLQSLVDRSGVFRQDLYYRLSTHLIKVPSLRDRREDIELLTNHFAEEAAGLLGKDKPELERPVLNFLNDRSYLGNVRELKTHIYDLVARCQTSSIAYQDLVERLDLTPNEQQLEGEGAVCTLQNLFGHFPKLAEVTSYAIDAALHLSEGNQTRAAKLLGISKQALSRRLKNKKVPN